ncbi:Uncharacterised protein [Mycobacteroides abscessus subsp. abscessus]|nr:Uncharacterised protein [Mycobacteroides abscessus subsp. abscessus]
MLGVALGEGVGPGEMRALLVEFPEGVLRL